MKELAARNSAFETAKAWAASDAARFDPANAFYLRQVHGTEIAVVRESQSPGQAPEADGWITDVSGAVLCVFMADCVPLYLWDRSGKAVGVFHAGWRGMAKGMPTKAVEAFARHYGIRPRDLAAEIGPHIGACCFRVGPETSEQFPASSRVERNGEIRVDLGKDARRQLGEAGVREIWSLDECTYCHPKKYFSFRREKSDNRMMAFIILDPKC